MAVWVVLTLIVVTTMMKRIRQARRRRVARAAVAQLRVGLATWRPFAAAGGRHATASRRGLALTDFARLLVVALLAQVLEHAGLLDLALELLERPVEAICFVENYFDHRNTRNEESDEATECERKSRADDDRPGSSLTGNESLKRELSARAS